MIRQTLALLLDAYRELNARKLFWIVLGISLLVAGAFACIGITDNGVRLLWYEVHLPFMNAKVLPSKAFFYKYLFFQLGFSFWLTWAAAILALISTASIIPDFVSSGAVELSLSKPIGRVRLFITKYLVSLLFVAIQVGLFSAAAFLVIGIRGGEWVPVVFASIPLVLAMFSYLYVISALVGLLTRSAISAVLLAGVFWFFIFLVQTSDQVFLLQRVTQTQAAILIQKNDVEPLEAELAAARAKAEDKKGEEAGAGAPDFAPLEERLADARKRLSEARADEAWWRRAHAWVYGAKTVLPKTAETVKLLERSLLTMGEIEQFVTGADDATNGRRFQFGQMVHGVRVSQRAIQREVDRELRERSPAWVLGTSLAFEAVVLGIACWVFARRDF
jgi:ABC-type transport system involved in multi-copper enzyme maturation permease subunit